MHVIYNITKLPNNIVQCLVFINIKHKLSLWICVIRCFLKQLPKYDIMFNISYYKTQTHINVCLLTFTNTNL